MDGMLVLLGLLVGLFVGIAPILAWVAIFQIQELKRRVAAMEARLAAGRVARPSPEPPAGAAAPEAPLPEAPRPEPLVPVPGPAMPETAPEPAPVMRESAPETPPEALPPQGPPVTPVRRAEGVEQALTSRWLVWLGAVAVGLSAVFLFSYAIEQGWLGPLPRVVMGLALGAALIAGGEWTHRHPIAGLARAVKPDYVPQALTAAGLFALYASLFSAHALYGLIGIPVAFAALGAVSFAALVLAIRQGWFVALLGLAGGYAMPALLESQAPSVVPVFVYVFALTAGCLAVIRLRHWPFLAIAAVVGSVFWSVVWIAGLWSVEDQGPVSLYTLATAAAFAILSVGFPVKRPETPLTAWLAGVVADTSGIGFIAHGAILVLLALACDYNPPSFVFLALYAAVAFGFGLRRAAYESLAVAAALVVAVAFLLWPQPADITIPPELAAHGITRYGDTFGPITMPQEFVTFARASLFFALLYGVGGFLALGRAATPPVWAGLSAAVPLYLLTLAYWRIGGLKVHVEWAALAAGLSLALLGAAAMVARRGGGPRRDVPLAFYAAGTTAALALAFTCLLREAWLTVALSLEVLALGCIYAKLRVEAIRAVALSAAVAVIVRLVLNWQVIDYSGGVGGLVTWVTYGYGVPAAAFLGASRFFGDSRRDPLAALCEAAAAAFAFLMVALQLHDWTSGAAFGRVYTLFDQAVQTAWWMLAAALMLRREATERSHVALYGGWALLALAAAQVVLGHLLGQNPLFTGEDVGRLPLVNLLGLAYLVPALLAAGLAGGSRFTLPARAREGLRIGAGVLVFVYLTLETRRSFQGGVIGLGWERQASDAEIYAYSAVWIVYSLALLAVGILRNSSVLRYASLTVLIVTVAKVFLYDMSDLTGLYRVASFLGLGLVLIGIGYVYRRFVFQPPEVAEEG